ncbi:MAG: MFS transporter [Solirubrobacteraceae bacterium]
MTTEILSPPHAAARPSPTSSARSRWAPLLVVLAGTFMMVLDFFIVNVALPSMQSHLHASSGAIEWVVAGYGLTTAVFLITGARLGDRWGRRRVFLAGLALFTVSSAGCGLAGSAGELVAWRLLQGVSAAMLGPNVLAIIGVIYDGADRARALAAYGTAMGFAAVSGQLIGGALVSVDPAGLGWRSCFLINVPVGIAALVAGPRLIPESRAPRSGGLDVTGTVLATLGLTAVVLPLVDGRAHGWPLWTWLTLATAPLLLIAFTIQQRRLGAAGGTPLLPAGLLRSPGVATGFAAQLLFWCGQASFFLVLSLYLQQGRGLSPLHAGLVFTVLAVAYLVASMCAPALTAQHGRRVLGGGALLLAGGHLVLALTVASIGVGGPVAALIPGLALVGAGMGLVIGPLATLIMAGTPAEHVGSSAGVLATLQNVGGALGVAIVGVLFYGAASSGFAPAFELSVGALAVLLIAVATLASRLPATIRS